MKPPIPAPDSVPETSLPTLSKCFAPKPKGMVTATVLALLFPLVNICLRISQTQTFETMDALFVVLNIFLTWEFWLGRNWMRWLTLVSSVGSFFLIPYEWTQRNTMEQAINICSIVYSVWLLYWLTRPNVAAFFKNNGFEPQN